MTKPTPPRTPSALKLQITQAEWEQLYKNGLIQAKVKGTMKELDPVPVVKLFYPASSATWLLSEVESDEPDIAFGLCRDQHKPKATSGSSGSSSVTSQVAAPAG